MFPQITQKMLLFLLPALCHTVWFAVRRKIREVSRDTLINENPRLLDRGKRDAKLGGQFFVCPTAQGSKKQSLFTRAKCEPRRCVNEQRRNPIANARECNFTSQPDIMRFADNRPRRFLQVVNIFALRVEQLSACAEHAQQPLFAHGMRNELLQQKTTVLFDERREDRRLRLWGEFAVTAKGSLQH